jgi:hypothetical protein
MALGSKLFSIIFRSSFRSSFSRLVIPAQAGIQFFLLRVSHRIPSDLFRSEARLQPAAKARQGKNGIPACAGMTQGKFHQHANCSGHASIAQARLRYFAQLRTLRPDRGVRMTAKAFFSERVPHFGAVRALARRP